MKFTVNFIILGFLITLLIYQCESAKSWLEASQSKIKQIGELTVQNADNEKVFHQILENGAGLAALSIPAPVGPIIAAVSSVFFVITNTSVANKTTLENNFNKSLENIKNKLYNLESQNINTKSDIIIETMTHEIYNLSDPLKMIRVNLTYFNDYFNKHYTDCLMLDKCSLNDTNNMMKSLINDDSQFRSTLSLFVETYIDSEKNVFKYYEAYYKSFVSIHKLFQ